MPVKSPDRSSPSRTPPAEWIIGGLGLLIVLGTLAVLLSEVFAGRPSPPRLSVQPAALTPTAAGWLQQVEVRNDGDTTAAAVTIEGVSGDQTAQVTLDYVPAHARVSAGLQFPSDPRGAGVALHATGYQEP